MENEDLVQWVRADVAARLDELVRGNGHGPGPTDQARRDLIAAALEQRLGEQVRSGLALPARGEIDAIASVVAMSFSGLGGFEELLGDPTKEEGRANGCDNVWARYSGDPRRYRVGPVARSDGELIEVARHIMQSAGQLSTRFDDEVPYATVDLGDGTRFTAIMRICGPRPRVFFCRPVVFAPTLDDLCERGMMSADLRQFVAAAVRARKTIFVSGSHGVGKTTFLRSLLGECEPWEQKLTVEKTAELQLERFPDLHPNVLPLLVRAPNQEGKGGISQSQLVELSLVSRPDRLAVGEILGDECVPALYALSGGIDGSFFSIHAKAPGDVFEWLALLAGGAPQRVDRRTTLGLAAQGIDLIVHLGWDRARKRRVVVSVLEVEGYRQETDAVHTGTIYAPDADGCALRTGTALLCQEDLLQAGLDPRWALAHQGGRW